MTMIMQMQIPKMKIWHQINNTLSFRMLKSNQSQGQSLLIVKLKLIQVLGI